LKITIERPSRYNFQRGVKTRPESAVPFKGISRQAQTVRSFPESFLRRTCEIIVAGGFSFFLPEPAHPGIDGREHRAEGHMEIDPCLEDLMFRMLEFLRRDLKT